MHLSFSKSLSSMDQPSTSASKRPGQHRPNDPPPTVVDAAVDPPEQPVVMTYDYAFYYTTDRHGDA
jgi:hypothetical protein